MLLRLKVKPGSKKDEILREDDRTLTVKIRAQPVDGKANKYLIEYFSKILNVPKSKIILNAIIQSQLNDLSSKAEIFQLNISLLSESLE